MYYKDEIYDYTDSLMHKAHKYIAKKRVNGKWRYYYKPNKWEINSKNYKKKVAEISKEKEWQDIVKRNDPEYRYIDNDGNVKYDIDKYMVNKKHPVIDALTDFGYGRKVTVLKQNGETVVAGGKDYAEMGRRTIENILTLGIGILTAKIKNQQGSYDDEKAQLRSDIKTAEKMTKQTLNSYNSVSNGSISDKDIARAATIGEQYIKKYTRN